MKKISKISFRILGTAIIVLGSLLLLFGASQQPSSITIGGIHFTAGANIPAACYPDGSFFFKTGTGWYQCVNATYSQFGGGYAGVTSDGSNGLVISGNLSVDGVATLGPGEAGDGTAALKLFVTKNASNQWTKTCTTTSLNVWPVTALNGTSVYRGAPGDSVTVTFSASGPVQGHYVGVNASCQAVDLGATASTSLTNVGIVTGSGCTTDCTITVLQPYIASTSGGVTVSAWQSPATSSTTLSTAPLNTTKLWGFYLPFTITTSAGCWYTGTADNTTDVYDIGIYDASGTLKVHVGATAGSTLFPGAAIRCANWLSGATLTPGKYYWALTSGTSATAAFGGSVSANFLSNTAPSSGSATTGGVLNNSVGIPADSYSTGTSPQIVNFQLH